MLELIQINGIIVFLVLELPPPLPLVLSWGVGVIFVDFGLIETTRQKHTIDYTASIELHQFQVISKYTTNYRLGAKSLMKINESHPPTTSNSIPPVRREATIHTIAHAKNTITRVPGTSLKVFHETKLLKIRSNCLINVSYR